jgi:hypothetical protein
MDLKNRVINDYINPMYENDIKDLTVQRFRWRKAGNISEAISKALFGVSILTNFSSGYYNIRELSYASGMTNSMALVLLSISSYCMKESAERNTELNIILHRLKLEPKKNRYQ